MSVEIFLFIENFKIEEKKRDDNFKNIVREVIKGAFPSSSKILKLKQIPKNQKHILIQ